MLKHKIVEADTPWRIQHTTELGELLINEGAQIIGPEGKVLTLTVNGCGMPIRPGFYKGEVVVSVTDPYPMSLHGLHLNFFEMFHQGAAPGPNDVVLSKLAAVIKDNQVLEQYMIPAIIQDGSITGEKAENVYIGSCEDDFYGIAVEGNSKYEIRNCRFDLEGNGSDDWQGVGAAVSAADDVELLVEGCQFHYSGYTRCTLMAGGRAKITVRDCDFINMSPDGSDWVGGFSWQVGFKGHCRMTQLCDQATIVYENCRVHGNGWGLFSIDGSGDPTLREDDPEWPEGVVPGYGVTMTVKDSVLDLSGPRQHGYGAFCIGDNHITFDNTKANVFGYPVLLRGMDGKGRFDVINGSKMMGRRFGAMVVGDSNSVLNIENSSFNTGKANIVCKGSATTIEIKNSEMVAGNGTLLQLMDSDEGGMNRLEFIIPAHEKDVKDPNRDLTTVSSLEDVTLNLTDDNITGNVFNSTTNIRAFNRGAIGGMGKLHDHCMGVMPEMPADAPNPTAMAHNGNDLMGAFNLGVNLVNTTLTGIISAASQHYRDGLYMITAENLMDLSDVTQKAQPPVNNGVVVSLDASSTWNVADTSYISKLVIADGAKVNARRMLVDGAETAIAPGTYTGEIVLEA